MVRFINILVLLCVLTGCVGPTDKETRHYSVLLKTSRGQCSGEQVKAPSGVSYILTAAHCLPLAIDGQIQVTTEDGRTLKRHVIAEDDASDLLLLEGIPGMEGMPIARTSWRGQHVRTFTHGHGLKTYRTDGVLVQDQRIQIPISAINSPADEAACSAQSKTKIFSFETIFGPISVCALDIEEAVTTAFIVPGSSGGMVVDDAGQLVGVVSAGGGGFGFLVTLDDIHSFLSNY